MYMMSAIKIETTSAAGCAHASPVTPNAVIKTYNAGIYTNPCLLILMTKEDFAAPIA